MGAANLDLQIEQGATFQRTLTIKDANSVPIALTAWTFRGQIRPSIAAASPTVAFTFTLADQLVSPGQVVVSLTAVQTAAIPATQPSTPTRPETVYIYDIEGVDGDGVVYRILQGNAYVSPEVTR